MTLYFSGLLCNVIPALFHPLLLSALLAARLAVAGPVLDTVAKIRALSAGEAARGLPVRLEATVIYYDPTSEHGDMFVRDDTAATFVGTESSEEMAALHSLKLKPGARIRIEGVTRPGGYFAEPSEHRIELIGEGALPVPHQIGEDELFLPALDSQWVEVPALVTGVEKDSEVFALIVEVHGWKLKALIPFDSHSSERAAALMQRPVRLQGIVGTLFNSERQMTGRYFFVPSFDQIVPADTPARTSTPPLRAVNKLLQNDAPEHVSVRIKGVVTQSVGNDFYLRDASASVLVYSAGKDSFIPGDRVEAEGFADVALFRPAFRARNAVKTGHTEPPRPVSPNFDINQIARFQAELIDLEAELLAWRNEADEIVLQCRADNRFFEAVMPQGGALPKGLAPGDRVKLTGICELTTTHPLSQFWNVDGFRLHLPKTGGVVILRHAPWWTLEHVLIILGIVSIVALLSLAWVWLLRLRVKEQTKTIGSQLKQVGVHEERQRIARELHDTVEQGLASLSMQMGSIPRKIDETPIQAKSAMQLAIQILGHCREEARASIQDLRGISLEQRGLSGALRELLPPMTDGCGADFHFRVTGEPSPIAGVAETHLLRIAQEGVSNAAHHAAARTITVDLDYTSDSVTLEICDDGRGFDPARPAPTGHFGILGVQERANKMQAALAIESAPGKGTMIRVVVPTKS
jgi:signal transduction histidine kinase